MAYCGRIVRGLGRLTIAPRRIPGLSQIAHKMRKTMRSLAHRNGRYTRNYQESLSLPDRIRGDDDTAHGFVSASTLRDCSARTTPNSELWTSRWPL
jgi:hypothetical protein